MDTFLRTIAIFLEVLILATITYAVLNGVRLTALDLGMGQKYNKILVVILLAVGSLIVFFFISHLTAWYPAI